MGRIAGVSPEQTREKLLAAAAAVFAARGFDGATTSLIAREAGVSSGSIYAHFGSKADLFVGVIRAHATAEVQRLLSGELSGPAVLALIAREGVALAERDATRTSFLVEAIVAARRHPEVLALLNEEFDANERRMASLFADGQADGAVDPRFDPAAMARFVLLVSLGSLLAGALDLEPLDGGRWSELIEHLVGSLRA